MADAFRPHRGDMIVEGDETELCQTTPPLLELPLKAKHTRTSKPIAKTQVGMGCDYCKRRKIRCDMELPSCKQCSRLKKKCSNCPPPECPPLVCPPRPAKPPGKEQKGPDELRELQKMTGSMSARKAPTPSGYLARANSTLSKDACTTRAPRPREDLSSCQSPSERPIHSLKYDVWKRPTSPVEIPGTSPTRGSGKVLLSMSLPESADASLSRCFLELCRLEEQLDGASPGSSEASWISRWWSSTSLSTCKTGNSSLDQGPINSESVLADNSPIGWEQELHKQQKGHVSVLSTMFRKDPGPQPLCPPKHDIWAVIATARKVQPTLGKLARCWDQGHRKAQSCPTPRMQRPMEEASLSPSSASLPRDIPRPRNQKHPKGTASEDESRDTSYTGIHSAPVTDSLCNSSSSTPEIVSREEQRSILLGRLMDYFFTVLANGQGNCAGAGSSQQTASSSAEPVTSSSSVSSSVRRGISRKGKRSASSEGDGSGDEENEAPKTKKAKTEETEVKRLACPFFKRDPHRYKDQSKCVGPGWTTVHRLKEHLYRRHRLPVHCLRCHDVFPDDKGLEQHSQSQVPCQLTAGAKTLEGITSSQERQLRSRRRSDRTEEEKWRDVYRICFPLREAEDPAPIPSPYFELPTSAEGGGGPGRPPEDMVARYDEFMARELPRRVKRALELRIEQEFSPVEESLKRQLPDIVRGLYQTLSEDFRRSLEASPLREDGVGGGQEPDDTSLKEGSDIKDKGKGMVASATPESPMEMETTDDAPGGGVAVDEVSACGGDWASSQPVDVFWPLQACHGGIDLAGLDSWLCDADQGDLRDLNSWADPGYLYGAISAVGSVMVTDNGCNMPGNEPIALQAPYNGENRVDQDRFSLT